MVQYDPGQEAFPSMQWGLRPYLLCVIWVTLLVLTGSGWGCQGGGGTEPSPTDGGVVQDTPSVREAPPTTPATPHQTPDGCHPFSSTQTKDKGSDKDKGDCVLPYPSSYYQIADSATKTGQRLAFPRGVLPTSQYDDTKTIPMDPAQFNKRDGFSPSTQIMALFPQRVDPSNLIKSTNIAPSLETTSPVQLIEFGSGKRIPLFAEVDQTVKEGEPQILLIRPMIRLETNKRYAVVLLKSLKAVGGGELSAPESFVRLAGGGIPYTPAEAALLPKLKETLKQAQDAGLDTKDILLAWDFHTGTDDAILDEMIGMRDDMLKQLGDKGPSYKIEQVFEFKEENKKNIHKIIQGTFQVPMYLSQATPGPTLLRDANGKPQSKGMGTFRFQLHIPRCALTKQGPLPIMQFGHGLFGGAKGEMDSGYQRSLINRLCMVQIGHDWIGLAAEDQGYIVLNVISDMNNVVRVASRLQQAHINAIALTRLITKALPQDDALKVKGQPIIDGKEIYYLGISNGAIQGAGFMALSPDVTKGILNVGGGPWSLMMSRSGNFTVLYTAMKVFYKRPVERQLLIAMSQFGFDVVDPMTFAPYVIKSPERFKVPPKKLIIQESIGDAQVPNISTRMWARTFGIPALKGLFEPVFGLERKDGPLDGSAYTQFGPKPDPFPEDANVPAKSNAAHEAARRTEGCMKQMETFFQPGGKIVHYCDGPCDPD